MVTKAASLNRPRHGCNRVGAILSGVPLQRRAG